MRTHLALDGFIVRHVRKLTSSGWHNLYGVLLAISNYFCLNAEPFLPFLVEDAIDIKSSFLQSQERCRQDPVWSGSKQATEHTNGTAKNHQAGAISSEY